MEKSKRAEIIEALKTNQRAFMYLSDDEKDIMQDVINKALINVNLLTDDGDYKPKNNNSLFDGCTYQISESYSENQEPEFEEIELITQNDAYGNPSKMANDMSIDVYFKFPNFIGFKFPDGKIRNTPVGYFDAVGMCWHVYDNDRKVVRATHVVLQK